ncbi:SDR family NAD(P)-dependent oxidoreductase [Microbacterium sp.]|uniref:SDR family NAD(P)-dependent oxidoreductase n=1 Tax=Microbacterium sp. TaxID=51671 RepID=UPI001AC49B6D|nr:SDR family oxidoreductase [Microbacterium sp.]MBN9193998.1 SDR family oxidoreductase [Microbacterium sp.]
MTGRRVLVAGATGAIGTVIAHELAAHGHPVAVHCRSRRDAAERLAASLPAPAGATHAVVEADLVDAAEVDAALALLAAEWGDVDDLVNAAWPAVPSATVADADDDALDAAFAGARGHVHLCRAALPALRRARGAVVFIGGALSTRLHPGLGLFGAGKAAATALTHVLALEEGAHGVRANVVSPGRVATGDGDLAESDPTFAALDEIGALRRVLPLPTPQDIARTVRWLLGPDATAVSGQTISLAGGERV